MLKRFQVTECIDDSFTQNSVDIFQVTPIIENGNLSHEIGKVWHQIPNQSPNVCNLLIVQVVVFPSEVEVKLGRKAEDVRRQ